MKRIPIFAAVALIAATTSTPRATAGDPVTGAILCHDAARGTVALTLPAACTGRQIDDAEAATLREERARRLRGAIGEGGVNGGAPALPTRNEGRLLKASASGFYVNASGAILTNLHAVRACGAITATGTERSGAALRVVAVSAALDLAVLKIEGVPPAIATFSRDPVARGAGPALVVGYTLLGTPTPAATATAASVSAAALADTSWHFAFAARIFPGHSGSPVLDAFGEVIGIVHARARQRPDTERGAGPGLAIGLGAVERFLSDNRVSVLYGDNEKRLDDATILARARRFVLRVECWS